MAKKKTVLIIQRKLPHYRERFFELLRKELARSNVLLKLIVGFPQDSRATAWQIRNAHWIQFIKNKQFNFGSKQVCWQPCLKSLRGADVVIVEQANKLLINYLLLFGQQLGVFKVCYWGHGKNFNARQFGLGEAMKKLVSRHVHWWFAYNDFSAEIVKALGYPPSRITAVQNTIDAASLVADSKAVTNRQLEQIRRAHNLEGQHICLYVGRMYAEKRIRFLVQSCINIRQLVPDFEMIFIGDGPDASLVKMAARQYAWLHYIGPKYGTEKVPYFLLAKLLLLPGLVGLAVVDALALETPLVTTNVYNHSPEIGYLIDGFNGVLLADTANPDDYASEVARILLDQKRLDGLMAGCRITAPNYTLNIMVERFSSGILEALQV